MKTINISNLLITNPWSILIPLQGWFVKTSLVLFSIRSTKGIKRLTPTERAGISIPDDVKEVLVGILLGDAHISKRSPTANSRLHYGQTTKHKEYFEFVYDIFKSFCVKDYIPVSRTSLDKRSNVTYYSYHFVTMQLPCFNEYRELFYNFTSRPCSEHGPKSEEIKKVIPVNIYNLLTPKGLAF